MVGGRSVYGDTKLTVLQIRSGWNGLLPMGLIIIALFVGGFGWRDYTRGEVVVEWTTASELSTAGFNLYRSDLVDGTYIKINTELIPASPDPLTGGKYSYIDDQVKAGAMYYYKLEDIEFDGSARRYGPIEVEAKRGGTLDLLLAMILLSLGVFGLFLTLRRRNEKDELQTA